MTDELTSEQEAAVRRLLAEARHDAPVPGDVAARLDEVLDELVVADGANGLGISEYSGSGPVTELAAARRRRRKAGRLLLAAAAVVVGGVAVGQSIGEVGLDTGGGDAGSADSTLADAPRASAGRAQEEAESDDSAADSADGGAGPAPSASDDQAYLLDRVDAPLQLSSANFAADVRRELARVADQRREAAKADLDGVTAFTLQDAGFECPAGPYGEGATLPAYYDAEEAVLVLRRPRAGIQRVDLLTCGTAVPLDSVELRAP